MERSPYRHSSRNIGSNNRIRVLSCKATESAAKRNGIHLHHQRGQLCYRNAEDKQD